MVRVPQYRNCIMVACKGHSVMRATLDGIVAKFKVSHCITAGGGRD